MGKRIDCAYCDNENLSKDEIGLNKKLIHHQVERMMCFACISEYFETPEEEMKEMVKEFKRQGCELFL